jgi:rsbT antagonist protein RsbS
MSMQVPIMRQGRILIASVQDALTDQDIVTLQNRLLETVIRTTALGVLVDVSVLDVIDSFGARMLTNIAAAIQLRGAKTVIVGIQPEVALSMVLLGLSIDSVATALDLDAGMALLLRGVPP